uniref:Uncharacterized protein n=1 Tax=Haptolina brevifila TaxID=156173 RepID=A0A7S2FJQ7_9EUKA|mmetsp:Transcript_13712/g.27557  ORF Transcript_13712/g.27557 Transcript_13712/m.27557 type:complete len:240 (+) Transcript_13712:659-1378(+)
MCRYAHTKTTSMLMTSPQYVARGWPTFERSVSLLGKSSTSQYSWPAIIDAGREDGRAKRPMAPTPAAFAVLLESGSVKFTNDSDIRMVANLYSDTATALLSGADRLEYPGLDWGDDDVAGLCEWLPTCTRLERLRLDGHPRLGNRGLVELAKVFGRPKVLLHLTDLFLGHESITMSGAEKRVLPRISNEGLDALTSMLRDGALPKLESLFIIGKTKASSASKSALMQVCKGRRIRCHLD